MTSAFLTLAAVIPAASIAAEPDSSQEGGATPEQAQEIETDSPVYDPGGDTDLPFDAGQQAGPSQQESSPDLAPLESEPADDPEGRLAPMVSPEATIPNVVEDAPVAPLEGTAPAAPPTPGFSIEPPPTNVATPEADPSPSSVPEPQVLTAEPGSRAKLGPALTASVRVDPKPTSPTVADVGVEGSPGFGSAEVASNPDPGKPAVPAADAAGPASTPDPSTRKPGGRFHTVQYGESLWTIAEDLLAANASAAHIAAQVAELWKLNQEQIASGDPNLIVAGERLRLR